MKVVSMTCPNCGANIIRKADSEVFCCEYCGSKLMVEDNSIHIKYDDPETAGYEYEKGRQRAINEQQEKAAAEKAAASAAEAEAERKRKNRKWWVIGWIFVFPVPLTILMTKEKRLPLPVRIAIIAAAWVIYFMIASVSQQP